MKISNIVSKRNRVLLRELVVTDFKLRYQGSVLGYLWSLLKPLFLFAVLYVVFVHFLRFGSDTEHFPIYLLLGVVLWSFFVEATNQGMQAIIQRGDLIRKINFPKYIIVISGTISALINLFFNLIVVGIFMVINQVDIKSTLLLIPINIIELYVFSLALAFILAAAYVKYRDVSHLWEVFLQAAFYATPILYPLSLVMDKSVFAAQMLMLNPMSQIIQDFRYNLVTHQTVTVSGIFDNPYYQLIPYGIVLLTVLMAVWYFRKSQGTFAEKV